MSELKTKNNLKFTINYHSYIYVRLSNIDGWSNESSSGWGSVIDDNWDGEHLQDMFLQGRINQSPSIKIMRMVVDEKYEDEQISWEDDKNGWIVC